MKDIRLSDKTSRAGRQLICVVVQPGNPVYDGRKLYRAGSTFELPKKLALGLLKTCRVKIAHARAEP